MLTGQRIPAAELYRLGVLEACVSADRLMDEAMEIANDIASKSPMTVRLLKESISMVENLSPRDGYRLEQNQSKAMSKTADAQEAQHAFVQKRKPVFTGK